MIYKTATEHINRHPYKVLIPPHVMGIHAAVLNKQLFTPIYEPFDAHLSQSSMIPIAKMVEFVVSNTTFTIVEDYDVLAILHQIDAYVAEVYPLKIDKAISDYLQRILKLRQRVYPLFRRVLNRRTAWKEAYSQDTGLLFEMQKLYQLLGLPANGPKPFFEELEICPTLREHPDISTEPAADPALGTARKVIYNV